MSESFKHMARTSCGPTNLLSTVDLQVCKNPCWPREDYFKEREN